MANPVFSERFHLRTGEGPFAYLVPAGKRAVVKMISSYNGGTNAATFYAQIDGTTVFLESLPGASSRFFSGLFIVAYEGENLGVGSNSASVRISVFGYLLSAVDYSRGAPAAGGEQLGAAAAPAGGRDRAR